MYFESKMNFKPYAYEKKWSGRAVSMILFVIVRTYQFKRSVSMPPICESKLPSGCLIQKIKTFVAKTNQACDMVREVLLDQLNQRHELAQSYH